MIKLIDVYKVRDPHLFLYKLLDERLPEESISHRGMPTMEEHRQFVMRHTYRCWYIVQNGTGMWIGAVYATHRNELGVAILREFRRQGYARSALMALMDLHGPLPAVPSLVPSRYIANVSPSNPASAALFQALGAKLMQHTYEL